jgi:hypothetical protein
LRPIRSPRQRARAGKAARRGRVHADLSHAKSSAARCLMGPGSIDSPSKSHCLPKPSRVGIACVYRHRGNPARRFLQQGHRNSTRNVTLSKVAMNVEPSHPPCRLRGLRGLIRDRADPSQSAAEVAGEYCVEHGRALSELGGKSG